MRSWNQKTNKKNVLILASMDLQTSCHTRLFIQSTPIRQTHLIPHVQHDKSPRCHRATSHGCDLSSIRMFHTAFAKMWGKTGSFSFRLQEKTTWFMTWNFWLHMISLLCDELRRYAFLHFSLSNVLDESMQTLHWTHGTHAIHDTSTEFCWNRFGGLFQGLRAAGSWVFSVGCADMESQICEASCEQDLCITKKQGWWRHFGVAPFRGAQLNVGKWNIQTAFLGTSVFLLFSVFGVQGRLPVASSETHSKREAKDALSEVYGGAAIVLCAYGCMFFFGDLWSIEFQERNMKKKKRSRLVWDEALMDQMLSKEFTVL